jgi:hypothetical protein
MPINEQGIKIPLQKPGQCYAVPCGKGEGFLIQVGPDRAGSITIFEEKVLIGDLASIPSQAAAVLPNATPLRRIVAGKGGFKLLNWLDAGKHALHPFVQKEMWRAGKSSHMGAKKDDYCVYSDSLPHGRVVSADEAKGFEFILYAPTYVFDIWLRKLKVTNIGDDAAHKIEVRGGFERIRRDPDLRARMEEMRPGYIAETEISGKYPPL